MLSKNIYKFKNQTSVSVRRKRVIYGSIISICILLIVLGGYTLFGPKKVSSGVSTEASVTTGDRPIEISKEVYINADGGLSLRESRDSDSKRLTLIPNGTKLTVTEELEGWYKVSYKDISGWIAKEFTTESAPQVDPLKDYKSYTSNQGLKFKYQPTWKLADYGSNKIQGSTDLIALSNQDLPSSIPSGSELVAPILINLTLKTADEANAQFATQQGLTKEVITVAGVSANKYTYTQASTSTQVTSVVFSGNGKVIIFTEAGGYSDDLLNLLNTFTIG